MSLVKHVRKTHHVSPVRVEGILGQFPITKRLQRLNASTHDCIQHSAQPRPQIATKQLRLALTLLLEVHPYSRVWVAHQLTKTPKQRRLTDSTQPMNHNNCGPILCKP